MSECVYVCCNTYTGKPNKSPVRVRGNRKRAIELINEYKDNGYRKTDKYLN